MHSQRYIRRYWLSHVRRVQGIQKQQDRASRRGEHPKLLEGAGEQLAILMLGYEWRRGIPNQHPDTIANQIKRNFDGLCDIARPHQQQF